MFGLIPSDEEGSVLMNMINEITRSLTNEMKSFMPDLSANIRNLGDRYVVEIDVRGYTKDEVSVAVTDTTLTVSVSHNVRSDYSKGGFYQYQSQFGSLSRSYDISDIRAGEISMDYRDGKLILDLPKKETK